MEHKFETSKTFDGPDGNNYAELTIAREQERKDAIQRGLIDDPDKPKALEDAQVFRGTCMDMCPLYEREQREYQNDVKRWEMNQTTGRIDKNLAVKAFHRPAAGNEQALPSDVRPPPILTKTLNYLVDQIVSASDPLDKDTHGFVRDRTRSIRQDFTLQNERGAEAIACHECIVRFHILSLHQMCEVDGFDAHQEMEQLRKTLQSLAEYYDDQRDSGIEFPSEAEFRGYHILTRLRDPDVLRHVQTFPLHVRRDPAVRHALTLYKYAQRSNEEIGRFKPPNCEGSQNVYSLFFRLISSAKTSYTTACLCETQFNDIRKGALKAMRKAFIAALKAPSVDELINILGCDDAQEVETQCEQYGIIVRADEAGVMRPILNKSTAFDESRPDLKQRFSERLVEAKRGDLSFADVINGVKSSSFSPTARVESPAARKRRISAMNTRQSDDSIFDVPKATTQTTQGQFTLNAPTMPTPTFKFDTFKAQPATTTSPSISSVPLPKVELAQIVSQEPAVKQTEPLKNEEEARARVLDAAANEAVQRLLRTEVQAVAQKAFVQQARLDQETASLIADLSSQLLDDLIRNQVHDATLSAYATSMRERQLQRRTLRRVKRVSDQLQLQLRLKRECEDAQQIRRAQYSQAVTEMSTVVGRNQSRKRARTSLSTPIASSDSVLEAREAANRFWHPIDLIAEYEKISPSLERSRLRTVIALADSSCKSWLQTKFGIAEERRTLKIGDKDFIVELIEGTTTDRLDDIGCLIFQCSGKTDTDRDLLLSLLQKLATESDYCFSLMLVCFYKIEDQGAFLDALMIPTIMADKKSPVSAYHVVEVNTMSDASAFESTFVEMLGATMNQKSVLAIERDATKEQERRRQVVAVKTPIRQFVRPRNAFYDYSMLQPLDSPRFTPVATPKETVPTQVSKLMAAIEVANRNLARWN